MGNVPQHSVTIDTEIKRNPVTADGLKERAANPHDVETLRPFVDYLNAYFKATRREHAASRSLWG